MQCEWCGQPDAAPVLGLVVVGVELVPCEIGFIHQPAVEEVETQLCEACIAATTWLEHIYAKLPVLGRELAHQKFLATNVDIFHTKTGQSGLFLVEIEAGDPEEAACATKQAFLRTLWQRYWRQEQSGEVAWWAE